MLIVEGTWTLGGHWARENFIKKAIGRQYGGPFLLLLLRVRISTALGYGHASETRRASYEFENALCLKNVGVQKSTAIDFLRRVVR